MLEDGGIGVSVRVTHTLTRVSAGYEMYPAEPRAQ